MKLTEESMKNLEAGIPGWPRVPCGPITRF